ncbi:MAG: nitroreductase family protein [Ilumatobacteraceae bacterium]|nr:nitroreductase family protein [Ilumatobacteraceae bacterium]MBU6240349.1 nitroreductase family protein [Acidobacteriota bacterium]
MGFNFDLSQVDHLLSTTRAVRKRLDLTRPVPRDLILDCIRLATQAPAGQNIQKWRWLVVDDPKMKEGLADIYRKAYQPYIDYQKKMVDKVGRTDASGIMESSDHLANVLQDVPALVIPCGLDRISTDAIPANFAGYYGSLLPAVWSFMLACRSRELGTAYTTLHLNYEKEAAELLGIPDTVTQLALIPVAYYTGDDFKPAKRLPVEKVTYFNGWKNTL